MLWHVVSIRFKEDVSTDERWRLEADLKRLGTIIDDALFYRVTPSSDGRDVLVVLAGFADQAALDRYLEHPEHVPMSRRVATLRAGERNRINFETADALDCLPRTLP